MGLWSFLCFFLALFNLIPRALFPGFGGGVPHLQSQGKAPLGWGWALWASVHDLKISWRLRVPSPRSNTDTIANSLTSQVSPHVKECKTVPSHAFQILDSSLCQWSLDSRTVVLDRQEQLMKIAILISALYKFYYYYYYNYYYYYYSGLHSLRWSYSTCSWSTIFP